MWFVLSCFFEARYNSVSLPIYIAWQSKQTTCRIVFRLLFVFYVSHYMSYCRHRLMREYVVRSYDVNTVCTVSYQTLGLNLSKQ